METSLTLAILALILAIGALIFAYQAQVKASRAKPSPPYVPPPPLPDFGQFALKKNALTWGLVQPHLDHYYPTREECRPIVDVLRGILAALRHQYHLASKAAQAPLEAEMNGLQSDIDGSLAPIVQRRDRAAQRLRDLESMPMEDDHPSDITQELEADQYAASFSNLSPQQKAEKRLYFFAHRDEIRQKRRQELPLARSELENAQRALDTAQADPTLQIQRRRIEAIRTELSQPGSDIRELDAIARQLKELTAWSADPDDDEGEPVSDDELIDEHGDAKTWARS